MHIMSKCSFCQDIFQATSDFIKNIYVTIFYIHVKFVLPLFQNIRCFSYFNMNQIQTEMNENIYTKTRLNTSESKK